jgi:two-component sensor histidine kinase
VPVAASSTPSQTESAVVTTTERLIGALERHERERLRELLRFWGFLADLAFSDLVVAIPDGDDFVVVAQIRPATAQTVHPGDLVGSRLDRASAPHVAEALEVKAVASVDRLVGGRPVRSSALPLSVAGREPFGALVRERAIEIHRSPGELEATYRALFDRFGRMVVQGRFPYTQSEVEEAPRVGDGVLVLDRDERITFLSPNATSALHRLGATEVNPGTRLAEVGVGVLAPSRAAVLAAPVLEEVEHTGGATVTFYCLPLYDRDELTGFVVLVRDVTDIRQRERVIASKDATIREVHHRVKNNLQTISSLLRLQARRLEDREAKAALGEAERRIRSIALVHEFLSRDVSEQVEVDEVLGAICRLAEESTHLDRELDLRVEGTIGRIPASCVTPLAIALAELIQNSLEHGYGTERTSLRVMVTLERHGDELAVEVADNGVGYPDDLDERAQGSLGLAIVRDLVVSQLRGSLVLGRSLGGGAQARIRIPLEGEEP